MMTVMCTPENKTLEEISMGIEGHYDIPDVYFNDISTIADVEFDDDKACETYMLKDEVLQSVIIFNGYDVFLTQSELIEVSKYYLSYLYSYILLMPLCHSLCSTSNSV